MFRDDAFFRGWTECFAMDVRWALFCHPQLHLHSFQLVIHLTKLVQPLVVVLTQGAHVKTCNGRESFLFVAIDLRRASTSTSCARFSVPDSWISMSGSAAGELEAFCLLSSIIGTSCTTGVGCCFLFASWQSNTVMR